MSPEAVSKAARDGRLRESIVMIKGQPKIADAELADREWERNTQPRADLPRRRSGDSDDELPEGIPSYDVSRAVREFHAARREGALADVAEIERDEKLDELVPVDEARKYMLDKFTTVRTRLLAVPSRVAQRMTHLAKEIVQDVEHTVDELIRETLEELAAEPDGDGEEAAG